MNLSLSKFSEYQKLFVKETSAQILEKLIRIFVGLYVIREISRYFDVELFGVFNFIESYFLIFVRHFKSSLINDLSILNKF